MAPGRRLVYIFLMKIAWGVASHAKEGTGNSGGAGLVCQGVSRKQLASNTACIDELELRLGVRIEHRGRGRSRK